jgi:CHAD domain-containing protein
MLSLETGETIGGGLTRIARATLDHAVEHLAESPADIHNARKRLKELRAILRLGRYALGTRFQESDHAFRDAGRELASRRDADARLATLESLREVARDRPERLALSRTRRILAADPVEATDIAGVTQQIAAARTALVFDGGPESLDRGLRRAYRNGRRDARAARLAQTPAAIHAWRKEVKYLWYQTQILEPVWPQAVKPYIEALDDLSHLLGEHHDLFVLAALINVERRRFGGKTAQRIDAVVARRVEEIEPAAFRIGALVYAEAPRGWSGRLVRYWRAWTGTLPEVSSAPDTAVVEA